MLRFLMLNLFGKLTKEGFEGKQTFVFHVNYSPKLVGTNTATSAALVILPCVLCTNDIKTLLNKQASLHLANLNLKIYVD